MTRSRKLLVFLPLLAALVTIAAQDSQPAPDEVAARIRMAEFQYVDQGGTLHAVPADNLLQVRLFTDSGERLLLELYYENGDYSMVQPQAFHIIRKGQGSQEVQLVRTTRKHMQFPGIP